MQLNDPEGPSLNAASSPPVSRGMRLIVVLGLVLAACGGTTEADAGCSRVEGKSYTLVVDHLLPDGGTDQCGFPPQETVVFTDGGQTTFVGNNVCTWSQTECSLSMNCTSPDTVFALQVLTDGGLEGTWSAGPKSPTCAPHLAHAGGNP